MHLSLPPPHSSTSLCPRNPHPARLSCHGASQWGTEMLKAFSPVLPLSREVTAIMLQQNAGNCSILSLRGHCRGEWRHHFITPKADEKQRALPRAARASLGRDRDQLHSACWELWEHRRTGHLGIMFYLESTLTKITDWTGALWYVCPTSIAKELHLPSFPDLYQSLRVIFCI